MAFFMYYLYRKHSMPGWQEYQGTISCGACAAFLALQHETDLGIMHTMHSTSAVAGEDRLHFPPVNRRRTTNVGLVSSRRRMSSPCHCERLGHSYEIQGGSRQVFLLHLLVGTTVSIPRQHAFLPNVHGFPCIEICERLTPDVLVCHPAPQIHMTSY